MEAEVVFYWRGDCLHSVEFNEAFEKREKEKNGEWKIAMSGR
jgi:hypothetical protein